ncbi:MAG: 1-acyl-sn-glycerol-3-phosphate acyltransferase [Actinomycetia bacterium]|nr:1-acyl-sn-glycerol-3-phosphate acyltransferase [Actinomycetes bacterium]
MKPSDLNPLRRVRSAGFPVTRAPTPATVEPLEGPELGDRYDTDWARKPVARVTRLAAQETVGRAVTTALCMPRVRNRDHLDELDGPLVFVANHHSHLDTGLVIQSIPRPWRHEVVVAAAADYFFDSVPKAAAAAWFWGAIPMERQRVSRRSALAAAELIDDGWSLLIFPEGGRSPDGWGQEHKGGAAYLSVRCGVPVVPVHIDGTDRVLPKDRSMPRPERVTVTFGRPLSHGDDDARRFAARIETSLEMLADEARTDWYSARLRHHARSSPSLRGPELDSWRRDWALDQRPGHTRDSEKRSLRDRAAGSRPW